MCLSNMPPPDPAGLKTVAAFVLDIDGVLYTGDRSLPGAVEFVSLLQERRLPFLVLTNNSTRTPAVVAERLQRMGMDVGAEQILTSSLAAALYLKKIRREGARVYVVGEEGLQRPVSEAGFELADDGPADFVVVGMDRGVTYAKLKRAALLIRAGARFIATNPDTTFPSPEGLVPGAGALLAALQVSTGIKPIVIGKPEPTCFELALEKLGVSASRAAAVGDRLDTDIEGGRRAGMRTILVLSGVSTASDLAGSAVQPTWVFQDLPALIKSLK
jgi:4-nitrophenyl phosphatase